MPNSGLYKSSENEHFEQLHGGAISQEMSFGNVAIFIYTAMFLQILEIFIAFCPYSL